MIAISLKEGQMLFSIYIFTSVLGIFQNNVETETECILTVQDVWDCNLDCFHFSAPHSTAFRQAAVSNKMLLKCVFTVEKTGELISLLASLCPLLSLGQVNDCEAERSLCSATLSHAAPSSQGMAKVQDGHSNACDRYTVLHKTQEYSSI